MFSLYAVLVLNGQKHRHYIDTYESLDEAKHVANCCTLGTADYAYIKDTQGGTIFFIRSPTYAEVPPPPATQRPLHQRLSEG